MYKKNSKKTNEKVEEESHEEEEDVIELEIEDKGKKKGKRRPVQNEKNMKLLSPSNNIRQRPLSPVVVSSPLVLKLRTNEEDLPKKEEKKKESKVSEYDRKHKEDFEEEIIPYVEKEESESEEEKEEEVKQNSEEEIILEEARVIKSPLIRESYSELKGENFEGILANFYYTVIAVVENSQNKVIFIICCDPAGNTVYVDIREEKNEKNTYEISTSSTKTIKAIGVKKEKEYEIDESIINSFEDCMGTLTYGLAIHSGNKLAIIIQDDNSEKTVEYFKTETTDTKNMGVYPIIPFDEIIADEDENGNPCFASDVVKGTLQIKERIVKNQRDIGRRGIQGIKKGIKELIEIVNILDTLYEESIKKCERKKKEHVDICLEIYEKYDDSSEGLEQSEKQDYEESKYCADAIEKMRMNIISTMTQTKSIIVPQLTKVVVELNNISESLKTMTKSMDNENIPEKKTVSYPS